MQISLFVNHVIAVLVFFVNGVALHPPVHLRHRELRHRRLLLDRRRDQRMNPQSTIRGYGKQSRVGNYYNIILVAPLKLLMIQNL
ncbi:hypothetical protein RHMOL_Rhmol01G0277100 [Rhododendron molle]|uniref:Uncharacterized protein n=1 Tax=Rhododendron molle TaxID=49168 RepID=A0ACC0Q8X2_RHOML|nr:hypothetical protein RHMOL_Rhmol01G0277100 [Rhododendron molle]